MATDPFSYWLLCLAFLAYLNTLVCYNSPVFSHNAYSLVKHQVNPLANRLFGTWTLISGTIRLYAAFHMENEGLQVAVLITLLVAVWHYVSEWLIFGSTDWKGARLAIAIDAGTSAWMVWRMAV